MSRKFKTANYEETLELKISLREALPPNHLARFVVDIIAQLDLGAIYGQYALRGGEPFAPEILLGLLFYGYATGVFSSRKIERATYESIPFRYIAGDLHPDHDTVANFRKTFLAEIQELFVQILLLAEATGVLQQSRWQQGACRCFQEQSGQLQTLGGTGRATASGSRRVVHPGRASRSGGDPVAGWAVSSG